MKISKVIGIDLGTTNSLAAVMDLNDTNIIMHTDKYSRKLTPSVVAYDSGKNEFIVGFPAFMRRGTKPEPIVSVKREMATPNKKLKLGPFEKTPVEISALILQETVKKIKEELNKNGNNTFIVDRAIITVPAYFNADQKEATCEAGKKAGLEVVEILFEPTAAAIYYSWKYNISDCTFMVYDLGGGTFDVSIIRQLHGEPQVLGIAGDNFLGGDDFDRLLAQYIYEKLEEEYILDFDLQNNEEDKLKFKKLMMFAEGVKKELSKQEICFAQTQALFFDKNGSNVIIEMEITRDILNSLIEEKVNSTILCCEEALRKAQEKSDITLDQIDYIVMVGGSTKIPLVQQKVKEAFCSGRGGKPKAKCVEPIIDEPDLAVALGAAIQAANYGLNMYDDNNRIVISFNNPGGTSRSTYNLSGEVKTLDKSINIEDGSIRINIREGGYSEEKELGKSGKFSFRKIPLQIDTINNLEISILDKDKHVLASFGRSIVQDNKHKTVGGGLISPNQLAKPFCLEIIKGNRLHREVLFQAGTILPANGKFKFFTTDQSGIIRMPFYEENRVLKVIEANIDTSLPVGTPVEFFLNCDEKHYITGYYKIREEQFAIRIEPPPPTPPPTQQQYEKLLRQFDEAISFLAAGQKMVILGKKKKICKDIEEAFQFNDEPKLRQRVAELEGLIKEIEVQDQPLEPPKEQFDSLVQKCHQIGLYARQFLEDFDLYEWEANIDVQRKFGEDAYQSKDQQRYGECYTNLVSHFRHLQDKLQDKIKRPMAEPTDEEKAWGLLETLQQGIEELEFLARAQNKQNLLKDIERQAKELKQLEPLCTYTPQRVIKDGHRIKTELQKIARQLVEDSSKYAKLKGLLGKEKD